MSTNKITIEVKTPTKRSYEISVKASTVKKK